MSTPSTEGRVALAAIAKPHGIQGALRMKVYNPSTTVLAPGLRATLVLPDGTQRPAHVLAVTPEKDTWIVKIEGIRGRDEADALRGAELCVPRTSLPEPEEGEIYHVDLPGFSVVDEAGVAVGTVTDVIAYPTVDALVVKKTDGREVEVPIVDGIVLELDGANRRVVIDRTVIDEDA